MHLDTRQMQQMEWLILGATTKAVEAFGHSSHGTRASTPSASGNSSRPAPTPHIAPEGDEFEVEFKCGNATPAPIGRGRGIDAILIESQESGSSPFADLPSFDAQGSLEDPGLLGDFIDTWHRGHASERLTLKRDGERGAYLEKWDLSGGERSTDEVYVLQTRTATIVNIPRAAVERSADEALAGATYEENVAYILRELASTMKSLPVVDQI